MSDELIIDASVAIKWLVDEPLSDEATQLLRLYVSFWAPDFLIAEVTNIAWKKARRGEIKPEQATRIPRHFLDDDTVRLLPATELCIQALDIALAIKHSIYDCIYLACAERIGGILVTVDDGLCRVVAGTPFAARVRHLTDMDLGQH